ncbi:MAG: hypothetical protein E7437_05765 [Ruminococcaceae bacterium]|nr:hypothetical protein [Oscillospiraceae bacterium]
MKKTALSMLLVLAMVLGFCLTAMSALAVETETEAAAQPATEAAVATAAEETIQMLYDDRKAVSAVIGKSATSVTIENEVVTSKKIGTTTDDDHVLIYEGGKIIAVGTGTATIVADGVSYPVEVKPARLSMFLITGHSVGAGQYGTPGQSVAVEAGQGYSSFERSSLTSANGGLGYGSATRAGGTGTGALDAFAPGQGGTRGVGSALAYEWNQLTGEKAWVMNLAIPGSCINEWLPGVAGWHYENAGESRAHYAYKYESVLTHFGYAQQIVKNEIAAGHYTLGEMAMFYFSGANFGNANYNHWSHASLKSDYETLWNGLKTDLAMDMDGVAGNETLEYMGIVPIWTASSDDYQYDKAVNYIMAASPEYPDVYIASDIYRDWLTTSGLATFPDINYTTQGTAVSKPTSTGKGGVFCTQDTTHLSQVTYNAVGQNMAQVFYNVTQGNDQVTQITLEYLDRTAVPDTISVGLEEVSDVIVPALAPEYASNITVTTSDNLQVVWPFCIEGKAVGTGTVTFTAGNVTKTLTVNVTETHTHCVCGGHGEGKGSHSCSDVTFTPWGTTDAEKTTLPASGNYYLVSDIALADTWTNAAGTTANICLNGHNITATKRAINIRGILNITDCGPATEWGTVSTTTKSSYGGIFYMYEGCVGSIYGGNWDATKTSMRQGGIAVIGNSAAATLNVYDGLFIGGTVTTSGTTIGRGGVFYMIAKSTMNMYGGTLIGGSAVHGGTLYMTAGSTFNMTRGKISGGTASSNGGNIYADGTVKISGGLITGGKASGHGGNVYLSSTSSTTVSGGVISYGQAVKTGTNNQGGNINLSGGTLTITKGRITGGVAGYYGGNICGTPGSKISISGANSSLPTANTVISNGKAGTNGTTGPGGNLYTGTNDTATGTITISGYATILGGKALKGGNIYSDGNTTISGGTIKEGVAPTGEGTGKGGNIYVSNKAKGGTLTVNGGTVQNGTAADGGNIYSEGTVTLSGGKVADGRAYFYGGNIYHKSTSRLLTVSGGTVSGGTAQNGGTIASFGNTTISSGTVSGGKADLFGGCIYHEADSAVLTVSGGTVSGGEADNGGSIASFGNTTISGGTISDGRAFVSGGNIYQHESDSHTLTVSGGTIQDGRARSKDTGTDTTDYATTNFGGNIYIHGVANGTAGNMVLIDGTISGGFANCGGNIRCNGTMDIRGGTITSGQTKGSNACGGNLYLGMPLKNGEVITNVTMSGGVIRDGKAASTGGNAQIHGNFTMTGGEFLNGSAVSGGNIRVFRPANFVLDGGTISGGYAGQVGDSSGGNVIQVIGHTPTTSYKQTATLTVKSGTITGTVNDHGVNGGAISVQNFGILNIEGGTINGGEVNDLVTTSKTYTGYGATIYGYSSDSARPAVINISGGIVNGGKSETYGGVIGVRKCAGTVEVNISGGTINGGQAEFGSIFGTNDDCELNITGGTFNGDSAVKGGLFYLDGGVKANISGGTMVNGTASESGDGIYVTNAQLTLDGNPAFSGDGAQLYVENTDCVILADTLAMEAPVSVDTSYVGKIATAATDKTACLASEALSLTYNADDQGIYANGLLMAQDGTTFATLADGLASGDHAVFTLLSNHVGNGEIQGKVWLNLNGFTYTGDLSGEGTLYGYDTATDDYDISDMGHLTGSVSCNVAPHFLGTNADIARENRYMAFQDENGYTFQRFDLKVSHISLRPATEGVGYKATVYGSDAVLANIETVGYVLQLTNCKPVSMEKAFDPAKTVVTLRVDNYDVENHGQTLLAATAQITLKDGTLVESKTVNRSLRNMLELVNTRLDTLTNPQIAAVKEFCEKYTAVMQGWNIAEITGWVDPRIPTPEQMEGIDPANIYYVGPTREYTSVTKLFMDLEDDTNEKIIFLDEGTYDIFREYRELNVPTPPDNVESPDYFPYCVFLPYNTRLIGLGDVLLDFSPEANEITYGESRTWSPLNIIAPCYIENIEIYCKNGRYAIHDDSHNAANDQGTQHIYKNVRCIYEFSDKNAAGKQLGFNNTIGNGMAQGTEFLFEDCYFEFRGSSSHCAFYTHESGSKNPTYVPTLTFRRCEFWGGETNYRTVRLQNLATADLQIPTLFEDCIIEGGLYLTIYSENSAQHFDVTLKNSGNPPVRIDKPEENKYPVKIEE